MIDIALKHEGLTGAADALLAAVVSIDPRLQKDMQDRFVGGNGQDSAAAAELDFEVAIIAGSAFASRRRKTFQMDVFKSNLGTGPLISFEHWCRAAAIEMGVRIEVQQHCPKVRWSANFGVEMPSDMPCIGEGLDTLDKRRFLSRPRTIDDLRCATEMVQPLKHGENGRDTDAAGNQHDLGRVLKKFEVIARRRNRQMRTYPQFLMDIARAAAARTIVEHTDDVALATRAFFAQRIASLLIPPSTRIAQEIQIPAPHQVYACADQADGPIAQIVRLPSFSGRKAHFAEQDLRNHPIRLAGEVAVKRTEDKDEPLTSLRHQSVRWSGTGMASDAAPQLQGGVSANRDVCIQGDDDGCGRCGIDATDQNRDDPTIVVVNKPIGAIGSMALECRC